MIELCKVTVTRRTPTGDVVEEHETISRRFDPNDPERELPVEPQLTLRVTDGGEHLVELQVADIIAIDFERKD